MKKSVFLKKNRDRIDHRYFAPEYATTASHEYLTPAVDIYAFGVLALIMASAIQWPTAVGGGGTSGHRSTDEEAGSEIPQITSTDSNESKLESSLGNDLQAAVDKLGKGIGERERKK